MGSDSSRLHTNDYRSNQAGWKSYCDRSGYSTISPDWSGPGWYRFTAGPRGRIALRSEVTNWGQCGTSWTGFLDGDASSLPAEMGQTTTGKVRFRSGSSNIASANYDLNIRMTRCARFVVFELPDITKSCSLRYCAA